jgi:hypothetical protein
VTRFRLGVEVDPELGNREINLRALFAAFDIPYDEERSRDIFARTMARLEDKDQHETPQAPDDVT